MTVPHYGKRNPGSLTASNPGDTLFFAFGSYNDSGDSEALTGLAVGDIEISKNGAAAARATDSGYSLISDTGQFGDRTGLYRLSVQLFNTTDDTGFFDEGSWYQVAVDAVTIDGKTVRFWAGSFEIGEPRANVVQVVGDTGAVVHLAQMADEYDTGRLPAEASASLDTGAVNQAVWQANSARYLTDTGNERITGTVWNEAVRTLTANTNLAGLAVDVTQLDGDTGFADRLGKFASVLSSAGQIDTGTGVADTGQLVDQVWGAAKASHADTGSFGEELGQGVNVEKIAGDTGAAAHLAQLADEYDTGRLPTDASASVDTGQVSNAVWNSARADHTATGSFGEYVQANVEYIDADTGKATHLGQLADEYDTGRLPAEAAATLDTGAVNQAVWQADALRTITNIDTGAAIHLAQLADEHDTGRLQAEAAATLDTGAVNQAVWQADGSRTLTAFAFDTGVQQRLDRLDTGMSETIDRILADTDTGLKTGLQVHATQITDTGLNERLTAIQSKTDDLTFSVANVVDANIQYVNNTQVAGTGDTGINDPWGPA